MGRASIVEIFADVQYGQNPLQPWIVSIYQLRERSMIVAAFFDESRLEQFHDGMLDTFELILLVIFEKFIWQIEGAIIASQRLYPFLPALCIRLDLRALSEAIMS